MKLFLDTNVLLDVVLEREPFVSAAANLLEIAEQKGYSLFVSASTFTDLYYIIRKAKGRDAALGFIKDLLSFAQVATVDKRVILLAVQDILPDFEDAVQLHAAQLAQVDVLITRNKADFRSDSVQVLTPTEFVTNF